MQEAFHCDVLLLLHYEFALLNECPRHGDAFRDVQDEVPKHLPHRLDQVVQVVPELVYEERLYYLVVEENALRETGCRGYLGGLKDWKLLLKSHVHLPVLVLESAHDVLTSYDEVHDASNQLSLRKAFHFSTYRYYVYELHEG